MKNIHVLPTDKPSRLWLTKLGNLTRCHDIKPIKEALGNNVNIYITSDEIKKHNEWVLSNLNEVVRFCSLYCQNYYKKIILTTDQELIKDGVQSIDDEFLEWFIKNPSCEKVEIGNQSIKSFDTGYFEDFYKIMILKEESKQETLEEVAEMHFQWTTNDETLTCKDHFIEGAKWQQEKDKDFYFKYIKSEMDFQKLRIDKLGINTTNQIFEQQVTSLIHLAERSYSEEDMKRAFKIGFSIGYESPVNGLDSKDETCDVWFEQFKNK